MTLDTINIDGMRINFAATQFYVAMSRCTTKEGLRVVNASQFVSFTPPAVKAYCDRAGWM